MTILDRIVIDKKKEVFLKKKIVPVSYLKSSEMMKRRCLSMSQSLNSSNSGIIAEHKRRSPSKAIINQGLSVEDVIKGYESAGVCGISILTDGKYFGGSTDDLILARSTTEIPILRKEFIIDSYQIIEAKSLGADAILLIASILSPVEIKTFSDIAHSLGMEVLLEVHNEDELQKSLIPSIDMVGVNNRNLKTFDVNLETSVSLISKIPERVIKVSESGITSVDDIVKLREVGYKGFLIGEVFMKTENPGRRACLLIDLLHNI